MENPLDTGAWATNDKQYHLHIYSKVLKWKYLKLLWNYDWNWGCLYVNSSHKFPWHNLQFWYRCPLYSNMCEMSQEYTNSELHLWLLLIATFSCYTGRATKMWSKLTYPHKLSPASNTKHYTHCPKTRIDRTLTSWIICLTSSMTKVAWIEKNTHIK